MDTVLGLLMTPGVLRFVLVEGREADGVTLRRGDYDVCADGAVDDFDSAELITAAIHEIRAITSGDGQKLHAIGVTWSDDADDEATLVLDALADAHLSNVTAVRAPQAVEALANGIARATGFRQTAVCVLEPEAVIVLVVDGDAVHTAISHGAHSEESLVGWLRSEFARNAWRPEGMYLVGSRADKAAAAMLSQSLRLSVSAAAEADFALAHGAALASASAPEFAFAAAVPDDDGGSVLRRRLFPTPYAGAMTLLVAGATTFVVSLSLVLTMQSSADAPVAPTDNSAVAKAVDFKAPAAVPSRAPVALPPVPAAPPPVVEPPAAPPPEVIPEAAPVPEFVVPEEVPASVPEPLPEAPAPHGVPVAEPVAPPPVAYQPPSATYPPPAGLPPTVPEQQEPAKKPGVLQRILGKIPGQQKLEEQPVTPYTPRQPLPPPSSP